MNENKSLIKSKNYLIFDSNFESLSNLNICHYLFDLLKLNKKLIDIVNKILYKIF